MIFTPSLDLGTSARNAARSRVCKKIGDVVEVPTAMLTRSVHMTSYRSVAYPNHIPYSPRCLFCFSVFFFLMKSLECIFELHEWVYLREKRISRTFWLVTQAVAGETWKKVAEDTQILVSVIAQRPACYKQSRIWLEFPRETSHKKNDTRHASLPITSFLYSSKGIPCFRW